MQPPFSCNNSPIRSLHLIISEMHLKRDSGASVRSLLHGYKSCRQVWNMRSAASGGVVFVKLWAPRQCSQEVKMMARQVIQGHQEMRMHPQHCGMHSHVSETSPQVS